MNSQIMELQRQGLKLMDLYHWELDDDGYIMFKTNEKVSASIS